MSKFFAHVNIVGLYTQLKRDSSELLIIYFKLDKYCIINLMQENQPTIPATQPVSDSVAAPTAVPAIDQQPKTNNFLVILLSVLLFISVSIAGFFAFQTQKLVKELTALKNEEKVDTKVTEEPTFEPTNMDIKLNNLKNGDTISSPLEISGTISRDWTFEANFSIEILDSNKKSLNTVPVDVTFEDEQAQMGSFSAMIPFTTNTDNGFVVIHADNPSGLPENDRSVEFAVKLNN